MKVQCQQCGTPVEFGDVQPEILSKPTISVIVVSHPRPGFCLGCKCNVALKVANANLTLVAAPIAPAQPPSNLIIAPGSALPKGKR